ncbi:DUF4168 domain-containing protein [Fischerella thermalis]|uniref:DUF4168 domain-containing protein n=1 Tax=Fischerella thermalis TaxID=372787 RepID=UPI000C80B1A9|nr:DUF4168 domain-containing protein [Fischerella thermalis]PLZ15705.1 hypothetical protein CBP19_06655 [Fischerella thermalis WC1110]PLZ24509.1 hypothetical protein CBP29_10750 [Fischerella thermalis WC341]PLZ40344.1 hypothetical protein CBP26_11250 [Fischerella thermalis WC538]PLZ46678.1 hypothetical protein CBP25_04935 [Fischerella thermalis WC527]PLZ53337.1 hypothetical protein CBP13_09525 [Fischerella thermalis WC441]
MNRLYQPLCRSSVTRMLSKIMFCRSLTIASFVSSVLVLSSTANVNAQSPQPNNTDIVNYSRALLRIEPERQQAFDKIKKIIGDREIPKIVCSEPNTFKSLPSEARDVAVNYCNRSQQIVQSNGLSIDQFNNITLQLQNNEDLKRQIYNTLIRLQKVPNNQ